MQKSSRLNVSMVKDQSRKLIFQQILNQEKLTRNDLARNTNLSLGTVKSVYEEFVSEGIILEEKDTSRSVGRKPSFIKLLPDSKFVCVLSITKDHFHCHVLNLKLVTKLEYTFHYHKDDNFEESFHHFLKEVKEKISFVPGEGLLGFGISVPGPYFPDNDQVICDLIPQLNTIGLQSLMTQYFSEIPVMIGNDVRLAALAASKHITDLGSSPLFYVYIAEGVGGALIHDGNIFLGANSFAGEIGQIILEDGKLLEDCISWSSMLERLGLNPDDDENLLKNDLLSKWNGSDNEFLSEVEEMVTRLAKVLSYIVCIINPKNIVIGGKYKFLGNRFLEQLKDKLFSILIEVHKSSLEISFSEENSRDPVIGSAMTVFDQWLESRIG